jgi:hypothetical protein
MKPLRYFFKYPTTEVRRPVTAGSALKRPPPVVGDPAVTGLLTSVVGYLKKYRSGFMGSIVWSIVGT